MKGNEEILAQVEALGGGYVWDAEVFAVTLFDIPAEGSDVLALVGLRGVQQIALNASKLSFSAIKSISHIPDLKSLVLCRHSLSVEQIDMLRDSGPEIEIVVDEI